MHTQEALLPLHGKPRGGKMANTQARFFNKTEKPEALLGILLGINKIAKEKGLSIIR